MKRTVVGISLLLIMVVILTACVAPTPQVVKETVVVEKPVEVTKEVPVSGGAVTVLGVWGGDEFESFSAAVAPFTEKTGIGMAFETTKEQSTVLVTRFKAGNPPDIAILPQPGLLVDMAKMGALVPIDTFMDMDQLKKDYTQSWIDLGSYDGKLYGVWVKGALKSLVWYSPKAFAAKGYEVPTTWDEMIALSDQIVADGGTPWCVGLESGSASGWPGTDWIEDIMLRTAGPKVYDQWVNHEIPWTDPAVKKAWELFGQIVLNPQYCWGGPNGVMTTGFGDSPTPLFDNPPGCYMHRQASFITSFFPEGVTSDDYSVFPFPPIDPQWGTPALGAGDVAVMLRDTPQARAFMQYLATPQPAEIWASRGGFISPNRGVNLSVYPDDIIRKQAEVLSGAKVFRFDGSDLMPAAVGAGTFWSGVMDYVGGENLDKVLQTIEASAVDAYGK